MSEQDTRYQHVEPTTPAHNHMSMSHFYEDIPLIPPPPPVVYVHKGYRSLPWFVYIIGAVLVFLICFEAGIIYFSSAATKQTKSHAAAIVPLLTPTLDAKAAVQTEDFSQFIQAFAILIANKDYAAITTSTDIGNFQAIPLDADGQSNWHDTYNQLVTGNLSFVVQYPPITPAQENFTACAYGKNGYPPLINVDAADVQYVIGTSIKPGIPSDSNGTVFIFELPHPTGGPLPWLWRGVTYNNQIACIPS